MNPRISPLQKVPSRPARAKHSLKSKLSAYAIPGYNTVPGYVNSMHPKADQQTKRAMGNAIERYLATPTGQQYGMPTPAQCNILFEGLI
jgi:hypothetical protein